MYQEHKVGLIGWNIGYSLSPAMHNAAFAALNMRGWRYDLLPVPPDIVRASLKSIRDEGGYIGVNVTQPLKQAVVPFVKADPITLAIGAANTIDLRTMHATNTDVQGFIDDLLANDLALDGARVLVLGAGGAARAAVYGLMQAGAEVFVLNRTLEHARRMLNDLKISADSVVTWKEVPGIEPTLVVNCTTVGTHPHSDESPWNDAVPFPRGAAAYDMVYRPERTRFLQQAEAAGGRVGGGLGMLVRQGALAFKLWTGVQPPLEVMLEAAREELKKG